MTNFNFFNYCSSLFGSWNKDLTYDCRFTVGSPSGRYCSSLLKLITVLVLILTLGVGNVWGADSGLTASPGVFILDFYDSSKLSSTSGTTLTTSNCRSNFTKVPDGVKSDGTALTASTIISGISNSGTVQYGKNGGLTFGTSSTGKHQTTISVNADFLIRKITAVGTLYDSSVPLYVAGTSVSLNTKGTAYASCSKSTTITPNFISSFVVKQNNGSNKGRSTLYTLVCEYGYRAYLTSPATGSISAAPKTATENGAGWNSTEGAVVGLKASQKVTLTATPPTGYEVDAWTIKKTSDNSNVTASVLSGTTLTMPGYDVTISVTWRSTAPSCSNSISLSKGTATNGTINTISSSSFETCSATGSDRRVTVTITPDDCYDAPASLTYIGDGTATMQGDKTDNGDGTFSYVYEFAQNNNGSGTFGVTCTAKAAGKKVYFDAGPGSCLTESLTESCAGSGVELPNVTATGVCKGWTTFVGWATAAVNDSSTTSVTIYAADSKFVPASNGQTLYAVYSKVKGSPATWDKVTALSGITAGTYVIVSDGCALQNTEASSSPARDATNYGVTISNDKITSTVSDAMKWTFTGNSYSSITIKSYADSDNYLYNGTNGNTGVRVGTTSDTWTFEVNTSAPAFAMYDATKGRYCCSTISTYNDWRSYTSADADNYRDDGKIYLFKQTGGSTTYYCSDPNCCTELGSINGSFFEAKFLKRLFLFSESLLGPFGALGKPNQKTAFPFFGELPFI